MVMKIAAVMAYIAICALCFCSGYLVSSKIDSKTFDEGMKAYDDAINALNNAREILREADEKWEQAKHLHEDARWLFEHYKQSNGG